MSKEKLLNIRMKLANPKIDDILEDYYKGKHDLISVRKDVLLLCDKLMKLAYNQALQDINSSLSEVQGREGCTYGDTDFDSLSASHGYNEATENIRESILKLKI